MASIIDYRLYPAIQAQPSECAKVLSSAQPFDRAASVLSGVARVWTVGIGTSFNAAHAAAWMLRASGLEARPLTSSEFVLYPSAADGDAVLLFAHTGRKTYSGQALALCIERGIPVVLITKVETEFDLDALPETVTVLHTTTQDPSAMYTVSHTAAMSAAARIAEAVSPGSLGDIGAIPSALQSALDLEDDVRDLAAVWASGAIIALGGGPMLAAAEEAHIKIAEGSRRAIRHQEPESFLHGPVVQIAESDNILAFSDATSADRSRAITQLTADMGCAVAWIAPQAVGGPDPSRHLTLPTLSPELLVIPAVVPAQLLAGHLAANDDINADDFRTDVPDFRAALSKLSL